MKVTMQNPLFVHEMLFMVHKKASIYTAGYHYTFKIKTQHLCNMKRFLRIKKTGNFKAMGKT